MAERITVDFGSLSHNDLRMRGAAVAKALDGSIKYTNPPVSVANLKSQVDQFHEAHLDATGPNQGSRRAMVKRDSLRAQLISTLKLIVPYVQANCGGDLSDSGFETYSPSRRQPQPVTRAKFRWIKRGKNSGSLLLMIGRVAGARGYEVEYTPLKDEIAGASTTVSVMNVKSAYTLSGLTPITKYMFRVRVLGVINKSDWSEPVTYICG